ncbi:unnamed protein product [Rhizopus stolonifer]
MNNLTENYITILEKFNRLAKSKSKTSYVTAAIFLLVVKQIYTFFQVPSNLRHLPSVSFFAMAKSYLTREPPFMRYQRITSHAISKGNGFYLSRVPVGWTVYIADSVAAKQLLLKTENFPKSHRRLNTLGEKSISAQFLGADNIVMTNGETWKKQRKMMNPIFHRLMPTKTMASVIPTLFSVIEKGDGRVPITTAMKDFTLDILGLTIFDFDFQTLNGDPENWASTYNVVTDSLFDPFSSVLTYFEQLLIYVYPKRRRSAEAVIKLNKKFDQLTEQKRANIRNGIFSQKPDNEKDLLTLMLEGEKDGQALISDEELRHNMAVFFVAGHDTTANTLSFCLYHIAKDKRIQQKLRKEILDILGDEPMDIEPTLEELKQMKYMNLVLKENLRMNNTFDLLFPRQVSKDTTLAGTFIPKGTTLAIDACAIHRDARSWKNPGEFLPERFDEGGDQEGHEGLTWVPFGNGSRQCIGMNFSLTEQRLTLAMLLRKYEVDVPKDSIHYDSIVYDRPVSASPLSLELKFTKRY